MTATDKTQKNLSGLYAITDENLIPEHSFNQVIELALQGGTRIIQYRDKSGNEQKRLQQASALRRLCRQYQATCIINDDVELAKAVNADGVHIGKDDESITRAREILGDNAIIGVSCYNRLKLAIAAQNNRADYVAFGAMFASPTKPQAANADLNLISEARQKLSLPICTIGGISQDNIEQVIKHGADMAAVISGLFSADDIKHTAGKLSGYFQ